MFRIFKNGKVVFPESANVLDSTISATANYAGIIRETTGFMKPIVYFSDKPVDEMTSAENEKILDAASESNPIIEFIRQIEVDLIRDEDGAVINEEVYNAVPRLYIVPVPEVDAMNHLINGFGVIREER